MLYSVPSTGYAQLLVNAGDGPTMLINRDETTSLYVGDDNSVGSKAATGNISVIDPLSYMCFSGLESKYGVAAPGGNSPIIIDAVQGATTWAPSPAQAALQISLLGLATATNQVTQNSTAQATNTVLGTGIAIPIGAAKDASVLTTNIGVQGINANHATLQSNGPNPFFTAPNGNANTNGWNVVRASALSAGTNGGVALPAGSGFVNGVQLTPNNTGLTALLLGAASGAPCFSVNPNQNVALHCLLEMTTIANAPQGVVGCSWLTSTGAFISTTLAAATIVTANQYFKVSGIVTAPSNAAYAQPVYGIQEAANIPATDIFFLTACVSQVLGSPGTLAGDHAAHIANTGVPLLRLPSVLASISSQALTTGGFNLFGGNVNQPAYEMSFNLFASPAVTWVTVQIGWSPAGGGTTLFVDNYTIYCGSNAGGHFISARGPMKADLMTVTMTASNNANSCVVTNFELLQTSGLFTEDLWYTGQSGAALTVPGFTVIGNPRPEYGVIGTSAFQNVGIGATTALLLPFYTGKALISGQTQSGAADATIAISDTNILSASFFEARANATGWITPTEVAMPRLQCILDLTNNNAAAKNIRAELVAMQY